MVSTDDISASSERFRGEKEARRFRHVSTMMHSVADQTRPTIGMQLLNSGAIHHTESELTSSKNSNDFTSQDDRQIVDENQKQDRAKKNKIFVI